MPTIRAAAILTAALLADASLGAQVATPAKFSAEDMLKVVTASVQALTDDGRLVAIVERKTLDNAETDNYRYGDPTYVAPSASKFVVIDTETGQRSLPLGDRLVNVRQAAFSRDGKRLAVIVASAETKTAAPVISVMTGPATGPLSAVAVKSANLIAANSNLDWSVDGSRVVVSMRTPAREKQAAAKFKALTEGPIVVQSSKNPFLDWDALSRENRWRSVAEIDVATGAVTERVPERKVSSFQLTRDQATVVLQEDVTEKTDYDVIGGTENQLLALNRGDDKPKTVLPAKDAKGLTLRWTDDGRTFAYAKQGEVFVRSLDAADAKNLTPKPKPAATPEPKPVVTPDEKKETETTESFSAGAFSRDGSRLIATSSKGWYVVNVADGTRKQILTLDKDEEKNPRVSVLDWAPDGSAIYATWGARDKWDRGIARIDASSGQMTMLVKDARLFSNVRMSRDGTRFVMSVSDGDRPADLCVTDASFSKIKPITNLNPWLGERAVPKSELVKYRDADGKELYGVLRYPINYQRGQKVPVVFELYETFFDNGFNARAMFLGDHGYAMFMPSVNLVVGRPGESWIKGVTAAANKLIDMGVADPDRLGVEGTSYGGYATVLLLTQTDRFKAAVNISGKVDMVSFYTDSPRLGVRNTHAPEKSQDRIGGTLWEYPERYLEHSAILQADRIKTPLLCLSGDQDPNVPDSQSREIFYALRRLGRDVEWVHYVNGAHRPPNSVAEAIDFENRILGWFDKYLVKADAKR
ncbi:MAG TPA: prolyl oligopeptidase family serine peptidase [Vicinamibacterales bacterium]|nr:prolyl oligopeptidase family serine peptidase [Vicinamibacterales bacterium]